MKRMRTPTTEKECKEQLMYLARLMTEHKIDSSDFSVFVSNIDLIFSEWGRILGEKYNESAEKKRLEQRKRAW